MKSTTDTCRNCDVSLTDTVERSAGLCHSCRTGDSTIQK
jgi:primosomal protein N'